MLIIPAIDILDGCVVRLTQGKFNQQEVYSRDPLKTARHWSKLGAELIHIVDLDGASSGRPKNIEMVRKILQNIDTPIQFGGGVRSLETIKTLLGLGVYRVVLGTKAVQDQAFLKKAFKLFKNNIAVSIDTKAERILTHGWKINSFKKGILDFVLALKKIGLREFIYTDILKDGTLKGPNIKAVKALLKTTGMKIIASGGISSLDDVFRLKLLEKQGLSGIIIGKALYEGRFTLTQALKIA